MNNIQLDHSQHAPGNKKYPLCFLAHNIDVPMNVGSLFRVADALGVEKIHLTGSSATPPNRKLKKTARSAEQYVPYDYTQDPLEVIARLRAEQYQIISLELSTASIDIRDFRIASGDKICLIIGSENQGVSQALLDASDKTVHIPMLGVNSSMNLVSACSIITFEMIKQF